MNNKHFILILLSAVISVVILVAGVLIRDAANYNRELADKEAELVRVNLCESAARSRYSEWWSRSCKANGSDEDCLLPSYQAKEMNNALKESLDRCHK